MKKLLNLKIIFIGLLVVILFVGLFLLFKNNTTNNKISGSNNKGLLTFFGERKTKPNDETTVPGVKDAGTNQDGFTDLNKNGINDKDESNTGGDNTNGTGQGNGNQNNNNGSLAIKNIGTNGSNINGNTTGSGTGNSGGPGSGSGPGTGGGTGGGQEEPAIQVDCTPKKLIFTAAQQKRLDALNKRFYELAAELKTEQDVANLQRTKENYINFISSDYSSNSKKDGSGIIELTKQCFSERKLVRKADEAKDKTSPFYNIPLAMRPNPFITTNDFSSMILSNPITNGERTSEIKNMNQKILTLNKTIAKDTADLKDLESQFAIVSKNKTEAERAYERSFEYGDPALSQKIQATLEKLTNQFEDLEDDKEALTYLLNRETNERDTVVKLLDQYKTDPLAYYANKSSYVKTEDEKINGEAPKRFTDAKQKSNIYINVQRMFYNNFYCDKDSTWLKTNGTTITPPDGSQTVWAFDQGDTKPEDQLQREFVKIGNLGAGTEGTIEKHKYDWKKKHWRRVEVSSNVLYFLQESDCGKDFDNSMVRYFWGYGDWAKAKGNPLKDSKYADYYCGADPDSVDDDSAKECSQEYYPMQEIERLLGIW